MKTGPQTKTDEFGGIDVKKDYEDWLRKKHRLLWRNGHRE